MSGGFHNYVGLVKEKSILAVGQSESFGLKFAVHPEDMVDLKT